MIPSILLTILQAITLQSMFGRGFDRWWRDTFQDPDQNIFGILGDSAIIIAIFVGTIIVIIIVSRVVKSQISYVKPDFHKGIMAFQFVDQRYTAYVNENHDITKTDALERLARRMGKDFVPVVDEVKQWINDGTFHAYDANIIKKFRNTLQGGNQAIILSPVSLDDPNVSKEDVKGEWSLIGTSKEMFRIFPRNIRLSEMSRIIKQTDYYGDKINVFILAPYTDVTNKKLLLDESKNQIVESPILGQKGYINLISFPPRYYESLAKLASKMVTYTELEHDLDEVKDQLLNQKEINKQQAKELSAKNLENQQLTNMNKIHAFVKGGQVIVQMSPQNLAVIAIISAVAGFIANAISGLDYFARLQGLEYLFLIATIVIILVVVYKKSNVPPPPQQGMPTG